MSDDPKDPFAEGLDARLSGRSEASNPYDPEDDEEAFTKWNDGWMSEDEEASEEDDFD